MTASITESRALSLLEYNLRSPMNSRWSISLQLAILSMFARGVRAITSGNGNSASHWKIHLLIGTSPSVSVPQISSTLQDFIAFFQKYLLHVLLCPSYLSSLSCRSGGTSHKLSDNQSLPPLSSSDFNLLTEEASDLCLTGSQYPLTSFSFLSVLPIISLRSLENYRFHQQLSLSTVSMSREGTCNRVVAACFIFLWFIFQHKYCSSLVIQRGVPPYRQALKCHTRFLCKLVKFFSQNPWIPSGPGAFQFGIFFNTFFSFSCEICTRVCWFFPFIPFLIYLNQVASLLCSTSWPQISVQNDFASCTSGITISSPSSLSLICL